MERNHNGWHILCTAFRDTVNVEAGFVMDNTEQLTPRRNRSEKRSADWVFLRPGADLLTLTWEANLLVLASGARMLQWPSWLPQAPAAPRQSAQVIRPSFGRTPTRRYRSVAKVIPFPVQVQARGGR